MKNSNIQAQPAPRNSADGEAVWPRVIKQMSLRPEFNESPQVREVVALISQDMRDRDAQGTAKYGVPLCANNGRNALVDAYQELLDAAAYLRQRLIELEPIEMRPISSQEWGIVAATTLKVLRALVALRPLLPTPPALVLKAEP